MSRIQEFDFSVDLLQHILWNFNQAENLQNLLQKKQDWYQENQQEFWDNWVRDVFDLRTANDFGLSIWSIILDLPLFGDSDVSPTDYPAFGFGSPLNINFQMDLENDINIDIGSGTPIFNRFSEATYLATNGIVLTSFNDQFRPENEGILLEGQGDNEFLNSEDFTQWDTSASLTLTSDPGVLSVRNTPSVRIEFPADPATQFYTVNRSENIPTLNAGETVNISAWVLPNPANTTIRLRIRVQDSGGFITGPRINIDDLSIAFPDPRLSIRVIQTTGNWLRIEGVFTNDINRTDVEIQHQVVIDAIAAPVSFWYGQPQVELTSFASSYIESDIAPGSREFESLVVASPSIDTSGPVSFVVDFDILGFTGSNQEIFSLGSISCFLNNGTINFTADGVSTATGAFIDIQVISQVACVFDGSNANLYVNGSLLDQVASGISGAPFLSLGGNLYGHLNNFRVWETGLNSAQVSDIANGQDPLGSTITQNFNNGNFATDAFGIVGLTLEQRRLLLRLRYYQLVSSGAVPEINEFLAFLFGPGVLYAIDNLDMTMTYVFTQQPDAQILFILQEFDLLPRPSGVSIEIMVSGIDSFGFDPDGLNFENGNFFSGVL